MQLMAKAGVFNFHTSVLARNFRETRMSQEQNIAFLRRVPLFSGLTEAQIARLAAGECFGEMSLIDESPRSASVITIETSDFMAINKESFKSMMMSSPEMCLRIMAGLVRRLREADRKIETLALLDVYGRVARVLLDMSEKVGEERMIRTRLPRQEIAKMIGASREMVSRVMKGLETEGYIVPLGEGRVLLREKLSTYLV